MAINMIAIITPVTSIFLSLPKIMGMGPIKITPPVLISLLVLFSSELSEIAVCNMLPMKIKKNPAITKKIPMLTSVFPFIINLFLYEIGRAHV